MNAYIIGGYRSAVGKAPRGKFRNTRPDDIAVEVIKHLVAQFPQLDVKRIDEVVVGNAFPEAEQGFNIARLISLKALGIIDVPGSTINRYCSSGLETIAVASAKIQAGLIDIAIAGGAETMSMISMGGWRQVINTDMAKEHVNYFHNMGLTAEAVAREYNVTREEQDVFAFNSMNKALAAQAAGKFKDEIVPIKVKENYFDGKKVQSREYIVDSDEGPRKSSLEAIGKLKPAFAAKGSVTAANSSQMSDGAAFVLIVSERMLKELNVKPIARLVDYQVAGCEPYKMGIGPIVAIPRALKHAGLKKEDIGLIELNEAFASQSIACVKTLGLNPENINVNGGAIALGHPLGCTGAKLTVQLLNEMKRRNQKYGMVSMCIGTGQGAAGIFEML